MMMRFTFLLLATGILATAAVHAQVYDTPEGAQKDPDFALQGEYTADNQGLQVIAQGEGKFTVVTYTGGLPGAGWNGEDKAKSQFDTGQLKALLESFKRVERKSPTLDAKPPAGAVVLFDGTRESLDEHWKPGARMTDDGLLMEGCTSIDKFGDYSMHLEFRLPFMPNARGQGRGNSGLYHQGRYETQMLDSFGLEGKNNETGGLYSIRDPDLNMCLPPLAWQTYDVDFTSARYDSDGNKTSSARITVKLNGVVIHRDVELPRTTTAAPVKESPEDGPIYLQNHGNPVRYRNIWVKPTPASATDIAVTAVFQAGDDDYKVYRIPAVIRAASGDLLAFCEARQGGDASEIDLVMKRSTDGGQSWGPLQVVQESDQFRSLYDDPGREITIGNPAPVVDLLDPDHPGRIWLPFTLENDRVFVVSSDDHGKTWSPRREITADVKKDTWGWYATGPVHSIQLQHPPHRGRLVIPTDHRLGQDGKDRGALAAHAILSDDHGKTWRLGAVDETYEDGVNANETTVVELSDGTLYFNTRDHNGGAPGTRGEAWSRDGGETFESRDPQWKAFRPAPALLDPPVVQCSLLRVADNLILFSGPDENGPSGKGRSDLRLRFSNDEAESWSDGPLVHVGPAAYSDLVLIKDGLVGVLFENGDAGQKNAYQRISFARLTRSQIK